METLSQAFSSSFAGYPLTSQSLTQAAIPVLILLATLLLASFALKPSQRGKAVHVDQTTFLLGMLGVIKDAEPGQDFLHYIIQRVGALKLFYVRAFNSMLLHSMDIRKSKELLGKEGEAIIARPLPGIRELLGENSFASIVDPVKHGKMRRVFVEFFTPKAVETYLKYFEQAGNRCIDRWVEQGDIKLDSETRSVTLELMMECILGLKHTKDFEALVQAYSKGFFKPNISIPGTDYYKAMQARRGMLPYLRQAIQDARSGNAMSLAGGQQSVLDKLVNLPEEQKAGGLYDDTMIINQMYLMLFAGHETTAATLRRALEHIHLNSGVYEKLRDEQKVVMSECGADITAQTIARMPYLDAFINEVFRITPIVPQVFRAIHKDVDIHGHIARKGTTAILQIVANKYYYDDYKANDYSDMPMNQFHPERWMQPDSNSSPPGYMPFGFGPRLCPGKNFAIAELKVLLVLMVRRTRWKLLSGRNYIYQTLIPSIDPPEDGTPVHFTKDELQ